MKILLVDNGSSYLDKLVGILKPHDVSIIPFSQLNNEFYADCVILSGGHSFPILGNEEKFSREINFVKEIKIPIFGICLGFQLIAHAFGAELKRLEKKENGILDIEILEEDQIFKWIDNFKVFENHRWVISKVPTDLIALAKSKDGIEAVKHKSLPIYGVQFHPEMFVDQTCGERILKNFLGTIG